MAIAANVDCILA